MATTGYVRKLYNRGVDYLHEASTLEAAGKASLLEAQRLCDELGHPNKTGVSCPDCGYNEVFDAPLSGFDPGGRAEQD